MYPRRYCHRNLDLGAFANAFLENSITSTGRVQSPRPISTGQLNTFLCLHIRPINLVVYKGPYLVIPVGDLILGPASRLDAFSAYPFRT